MNIASPHPEHDTPHDSNDTIVAVSSPPGRSPRGFIRIAGPQTREIVQQLLRHKLNDWPAHQLLPVELRDPPMRVLLGCFAGPRSYTGQHMAELQLPGHPALLERVVHAALQAGARHAEPGEFTFRAFLAGRLDLTQAEGIAATIAAQSDSQLHAATLLRQGQLGDFASAFVDELATQLALVEAGIDFVDQEDVVPIEPGQLDSNLADIARQLSQLTARSRSWASLEALPRVVLAGPPSAGKSTLFNTLLAQPRAVIDPAPGTTRDVLAEPMRLRDATGREIEVMLTDIAGLDQPGAGLDRQIQHHARHALEHAQLIVWLADAGQWNQSLAFELPAEIPILRVLTKTDQTAVTPSSPSPDVAVSAHAALGIDQLKSLIAQHVAQHSSSVQAQTLALQPRHEHALHDAATHLHEARELLAPQRDQHELHHMELIAGQMRAALDELASLGGRMTPDQVIGRVFATFCVGK